MKYNAFISYAHAADGQLTPILQGALHKLGKPWYKRRALNVFRDKTNLPVTPELWPTIVKALEQSEFFILMASPESATSKWVFPEVDYWLTHRSIDTLLIVHTGGTLCWDDEKEDFDPEKTDALHPVLFGKFPHEPFIVDLTRGKTTKDLNLSNPEFKDPVVRLAATLHKLPQNDFIGEEIKQHRRTLRIRNSAITVLLLLLVSTGAFLWRSIINGNTAERNLAKALSTLSEINIDQDPTLSFRLAEAAYKNDPENTDIHIRLLEVSNYYLYDVIPGKVLGTSDDHSKTVYVDVESSLLCILDHNTKETIYFEVDFFIGPDSFNWVDYILYKVHFNQDLTKLCLFNTDSTNKEIVRVFDLKSKKELILEGDTKGTEARLSASGDKLFISDWFEEELPLRVWDLNTGKPIVLEGSTDKYNHAYFTSNGQYLWAISNNNTVSIKIWDMATGGSLPIPDNNLLAPQYSDFMTSSNGRRCAVLVDNGNENEIIVYEIDQSVKRIFQASVKTSDYIQFVEDGNKLIVFDIIEDGPHETFRVFDLSAQQEITLNNNEANSDLRVASDGSRLVAYNMFDSTATKPISLWDLKSGDKIKLEERINGYTLADFSSTGKKLISISETGSLPVQIWDTTSGDLRFSLSYPYPSAKAFFSDDDQKLILYSGNSTIIKVIDLVTETQFEILGNIPGESEVVFTSGANEVLSINRQLYTKRDKHSFHFKLFSSFNLSNALTTLSKLSLILPRFSEDVLVNSLTIL